jgi:hypothetical protein
MNTIEKVGHGHWVVNSENIRYSDSFGNTGWYWDRNPDAAFPDTKDDFLEVLEQVLGEQHHREVMARPA